MKEDNKVMALRNLTDRKYRISIRKIEFEKLGIVLSRRENFLEKTQKKKNLLIGDRTTEVAWLLLNQSSSRSQHDQVILDQ